MKKIISFIMVLAMVLSVSSVAMAAFDAPHINPEELSAIYLRKPQAERELEEKNNI